MGKAAKNTKLIGAVLRHDYYGRVMVTGAEPKSRVKCEIKCIQRGPGWDESTQSYKRYKLLTNWNGDGSRSLRWSFTNRDNFGTTDVVHIKTLKKLN